MLPRLPGRELRWQHLAGFVVFIVVMQGMGLLAGRPARLNTARVDLPALPPLTSLRDALQAATDQTKVRMMWVARDSESLLPTTALSHPWVGPLPQVLATMIAEARLHADAHHRPLPEIEACFENTEIVVVRDVDLDSPCVSGRPIDPLHETAMPVEKASMPKKTP